MGFGRFSILAGVAVFAFTCIGCAGDGRISVYEYLQIRQTEPAAPTTQPVDTSALTKMVNHELGPYRAGTGDVLQIMLSGPDQTVIYQPVPVRVDQEGTVELPIVGKIKVAGLSLEAVEDAIQQAYVPDVYRQAVVHVSLFEPYATNVLVTGAVVTPGLIPLRRTERNLMYALAAAGGLSQLSSGKATLKRLRHPEQSVTLDLTDPEQLAGALTIDPLEPGDLIYVHSAVPNTVFVGGLVNAPRAQTYPPGTDVTVLQAIAASAGVREDLVPSEATLIHRTPDGRDIRVKLNLNKISKGEEPNVVLAAGDILWVPHTLGTRVVEFINRNFFFRAGFSATYNIIGGEDYLEDDFNVGRRDLSSLYDPFGELLRNAALQGLTPAPPVVPVAK